MLLDEVQPVVVMTSSALAPVLREAIELSGLGSSPHLVSVDGPAVGCRTLDEVTAGRPTTPIADESLGARVLYSGGTTGRPKRFAQPLLDVHPADAPRRHSELADRLGLDADAVLLSPAPNYHAAPFTFQLIVLAAGGTVVCMERFDAAAALRAIDEHSVTHSQWVPTMLVRLLRLRGTVPPPPETHRVAVTSGASCPSGVKDAIDDWWGPILHEYYGASEGYGHTYIDPLEARARPGSVGRPLGATRVDIVDPDGAVLSPGREGVVRFSVGDDASERHLMDDVGQLDEDGYLYLRGRVGFTITSGGVNVYPDEVEAVLLEHPAVADAAVIGVPDDEYGQVVKAVVELLPAERATEDDLIVFVRERLARFKAPRSVDFTAKLPRFPTGKLDKRALIRRFGGERG